MRMTLVSFVFFLFSIISVSTALSTVEPQVIIANLSSSVTLTSETPAFTSNPHLICRFTSDSGTIVFVNATFVSTTTIICLAPKWLQQVATVAASDDGTAFSNSLPLVYGYAGTTNVLYVSAFGVLSVTVVGRTIQATVASQVQCVYTNSSLLSTTVNATAVTTSLTTGSVVCPVAIASTAGTSVNLTLVNDGGIQGTVFTLLSYGVPTVNVIYPNTLLANSGSQTLRLSANTGVFPAVPSIVCRFSGVQTVAALYVNSSQVLCGVPSTVASVVSVAVASDGINFGPIRNITFFNQGTLTTQYLPAAGGGNFSVIGRTVLIVASARCVINSVQHVPLSVTTGFTDGVVMCSIPSGAVDSSVIMSVINDGGWTVQFTVFYYGVYPTPSLASRSPAGTPALTATLHTIVGSSIQNRMTLRCNFGSTQTVATYVSATHLTCYSPSVEAQTVALTITNDGVKASGDLSYRFYGPPAAVALSPNGLLEQTGSTIGVWSDDNYVQSSLLTCRFSVTTTPATYINSSYVLCPATAQAPSRVQMSVANDGSRFGSTLSLTYFGVGTTSTSYGTQWGGQTVSIIGRTMLGAENAVCFFGGAAAPRTSVEGVIDQFASIYTIGCVTPPLPALFVTTLTVVNDQGWPGASWSYTVLEELYLSSITGVAEGPTTGGTTITVNGTMFYNTATVQCRFAQSTAVYQSAGTYLSYTSARCISPVADAGPWTLSVSNYNLFPSAGSAVFTLYDTLTTTAGKDTGGDTISIVGQFTNAAAVLFVRFGTRPAVRGTYQTSTLILCLAPSATAGAYNVTVSRDTGTTFYQAQPQFFFRSAGVLTPNYGPITGNVVATITGRSVVYRTGVTCSFGAQSVLATVDPTNDFITCTVPSVPFGQNTVVSVNGDGGVPMTWAFTYYDLPLISFSGALSTTEGSGIAFPGVSVTGTNVNRQVQVVFTTAHGVLAVVTAAPISIQFPGLSVTQSGNTLTILGTIGLVSSAVTFLQYTPNQYFYGTDTVSARLLAQDLAASVVYVQQRSITVVPVNNAPTFVMQSAVISVTANTTITISGWALSISPGPNEAHQTVWFLTIPTRPELFKSTPIVRNDTGDFIATFASSGFVNTTVLVTLFDDGDTLFGGTDRSSQTVSILISADADHLNDGSGVRDTEAGLAAIVAPAVILPLVAVGVVIALWWLRRRMHQQRVLDAERSDEDESEYESVAIKEPELPADRKLRLKQLTSISGRYAGYVRKPSIASDIFTSELDKYGHLSSSRSGTPTGSPAGTPRSERKFSLPGVFDETDDRDLESLDEQLAGVETPPLAPLSAPSLSRTLTRRESRMSLSPLSLQPLRTLQSAARRPSLVRQQSSLLRVSSIRRMSSIRMLGDVSDSSSESSAATTHSAPVSLHSALAVPPDADETLPTVAADADASAVLQPALATLGAVPTVPLLNLSLLKLQHQQHNSVPNAADGANANGATQIIADGVALPAELLSEESAQSPAPASEPVHLPLMQLSLPDKQLTSDEHTHSEVSQASTDSDADSVDADELPRDDDAEEFDEDEEEDIDQDDPELHARRKTLTRLVSMRPALLFKRRASL